MDKKTLVILAPILIALCFIAVYEYHTLAIIKTELVAEKKLNAELTEKNNIQKETIASLKKSANNNSPEQKTDYSRIAERAERILEKRKEQESQNEINENSTPTESINKYTSPVSAGKDDDITCAIPSCNNSPNRDSFYCSRHECSEIGCHNQRANDLCFYCIEHKCIVPDCNSGKAYNSYTCYRHKN